MGKTHTPQGRVPDRGSGSNKTRESGSRQGSVRDQRRTEKNEQRSGKNDKK